MLQTNIKQVKVIYYLYRFTIVGAEYQTPRSVDYLRYDDVRSQLKRSLDRNKVEPLSLFVGSTYVD